MIRKNSLFCKLFKIKISSNSFFRQYMALLRPELETCPVCESSGNLHVHSYYRRNLIDFIDGNAVHHEITITRLQCDSCGSTHSILPDFIIPYCSYSLFFILQVLGSYFLHLCSVEKLCEKFSITLRQLYKWLALFHASGLMNAFTTVSFEKSEMMPRFPFLMYPMMFPCSLSG